MLPSPHLTLSSPTCYGEGAHKIQLVSPRITMVDKKEDIHESKWVLAGAKKASSLCPCYNLSVVMKRIPLLASLRIGFVSYMYSSMSVRRSLRQTLIKSDKKRARERKKLRPWKRVEEKAGCMNMYEPFLLGTVAKTLKRLVVC